MTSGHRKLSVAATTQMKTQPVAQSNNICCLDGAKMVHPAVFSFISNIFEKCSREQVFGWRKFTSIFLIQKPAHVIRIFEFFFGCSLLLVDITSSARQWETFKCPVIGPSWRQVPSTHIIPQLQRSVPYCGYLLPKVRRTTL